MRRLPATCLVAFLIAATAMGAGCGEGGVEGGATVSVYVAAPLCKGALTELRHEGGEAGDLKVRAVCLAATEHRGGADLAVAGADARRATEDSASVAFIEAPGRTARFARPIVESANIAFLAGASGGGSMRSVLRALEDRGSSSPRSAVLDQVG